MYEDDGLRPAAAAPTGERDMRRPGSSVAPFCAMASVGERDQALPVEFERSRCPK